MVYRSRNPLTRRELLKLGAMAGAIGVIAPPVFAASKPAGASGQPILRAIPGSGEKLPAVGLGTNNYSPTTPEDRAARREVLEHMPRLGGKVIDTAPAYGQSEATLGALLAELGNRKQFFLATKVTAPGGDAARGAQMITESFQKLRTDQFDLMQVHNLDGVDELMPALRDGKSAKRFRYVGITTSNTDAHGRMMEHMRKHPLDFIQVDYSIDNRAAADQVLPLAQEKGMGVLINMPFGGRRDGNLLRKLGEKELPGWAAEIGASSWAQALLKYVLSHPAVTVAIPGTTRLTHLEDNQAAGRGELPDAALRKRMEEWWDANAG